MENKIKAFPNGNEITDEAGMNLRDYFAIRIYTKLMELEVTGMVTGAYDHVQEYANDIAVDAYKMADAMMEERK
jgi:hypothetical protein